MSAWVSNRLVRILSLSCWKLEYSAVGIAKWNWGDKQKTNCMGSRDRFRWKIRFSCGQGHWRRSKRRMLGSMLNSCLHCLRLRACTDWWHLHCLFARWLALEHFGGLCWPVLASGKEWCTEWCTVLLLTGLGYAILVAGGGRHLVDFKVRCGVFLKARKWPFTCIISRRLAGK